MSINNPEYIAKSNKWYSIKELLEYKIGGRFTPKKSQLVKNA